MGFIPQWARPAQSAWRYRGQERPPFAVVPGPGRNPCGTIRGRPEWYPTPARSLSGWAHTKSPAPDEVCDCWKRRARPRCMCHRMTSGWSASRGKPEPRAASGRARRMVGDCSRPSGKRRRVVVRPIHCQSTRTHPGLLRLLPISGRMRVRFNSSRRAAWSVLRRVGHARRRRTLQG